jgi:2-methylaconitate cis-trans-isomerase PrpF
MQKKIPAVFMRGGTSKALFFHENHLPKDPMIRDRVIQAAYGSPDPDRRQIDGIGGAVSTTSKAAIISRSEDPNFDVVYNFGQVAIDRPMVDYKGNCGNISSAVGPFAVDEGLVKIEEPVTRVRIFQKNTEKLIIAEVPVRAGVFDEAGDYSIAGVPGSGSKITLRFSDPGGSVTGRLFPTGNPVDILDVPEVGRIKLTIMDAANPVVMVPAKDIGLTGTEIDKIESSESIKAKLEAIRCWVAVKIGLAETPQEASLLSQAVPKIACVAPSQKYKTLGGRTVETNEIDLVARIMSMGTLHKSFAVSGAISTVGAAMTEGTVVHEMLNPEAGNKKTLHIGHPGGIIEVGAKIEKKGKHIEYKEAVLARTARRLMEGYVLVPQKYFSKEMK